MKFDRLRRRSSAPTRAATATTAALFEDLERRAMLTASLNSGVLTVTGTSASEVISLNRSGGNLVVQVGAQQNIFTNSQIIQINVAAGDGNDVVVIGAGIIGAYVDGQTGNDNLVGGDANDTLLGGAGRNTLSGGEGADNLRGSGGRDFEYGQGGNDRLYGNGGDDWLDGGGNVDRLYGNDGNDWLGGASSNDKLYGGAGADSLEGGKGDDLLSGEAGTDAVNGADGSDVLYGGDDSDTIHGGNQDDFAYGNGGNDFVFGDAGSDALAGDGENQVAYKGAPAITYPAGNDSLDGGDGNDWLVGGPQSTTLTIVDNGADTFTGGLGSDILDKRGSNDVVTDESAGDVIPVVQSNRVDTNNSVVHHHASLHIWVNQPSGPAKEIAIPGGIGDFERPAVHTHAADNTVHMHDSIVRDFTLGEFFRNWGITFSTRNLGQYIGPNGYVLLQVNNVLQPSLGAYVMHDGDQMVITIG